MKFFKIIIIIFFKIVFISSTSFALKPCPKNQEAFKDNSFGKYEFSSGENYIGEWKNDKINDNELKDYLDETMTYFARRYYGGSQKFKSYTITKKL